MKRISLLIYLMILPWVPAHASSLTFDGGGSHYALSNFSGPSISAYTVSCWVFVTFSSAPDSFACGLNSNSSVDKALLVVNTSASGGATRFCITVNSSQTCIQGSGDQGCPTSKWCHIAGTYDGSTAALYMDGSQMATASVGTHSLTLVETFAGSACACTIGELSIWNKALNKIDLNALAGGVGAATGAVGVAPWEVARSSLLVYFPLRTTISPQPSYDLNNYSLTLTTGITLSTLNPPIEMTPHQ